ncbi:MAG TPA: glycosyltransferase [Gemmatimonadaceae bacterium]|nr:glycosyltransferase [Gemmatimonadaceae bacterium]
MNPTVSVVIPTFNAGPVLEQVLGALESQDCGCVCEILAIDSGSTDGSIECLARHGATVLHAGRNGFNHGDTRNAALSHVRGAFAVLLVQDAVPASQSWLSALIEPLIGDETVAGSFARQAPAPGASSVTTYYLSKWAAAGDEPRVAGPLTREEFEGMSPHERHATCAFDNVCSCIRVSAWRAHPFRRTAIAEDLEWARDVLLAGYRLVYAPAAVVRHSHERSIRYELQRTYLVHQRLQLLFGLSTIPTVGSLVRSVAATVPANARIAARDRRGRARAVLRGAALGVAMPLGQYLGARSAREGRELLRTDGV